MNNTVVLYASFWLYKQNSQNIEALCEHLKCPKDIQQISELVAEWSHFAMNFLSFNPQEVLNFYLKNDGLRRHKMNLRWIDVIQHPSVLLFYLSLHVQKLDLKKEFATLTYIPGTRATYGNTFLALTLIQSLHNIIKIVFKCLPQYTT